MAVRGVVRGLVRTAGVPFMDLHRTRARAAWPTLPDLPPALRDCAAWWLGALDRALRERDYSAAAEADRELDRLGWHVSARPAPRKEARHVPPG